MIEIYQIEIQCKLFVRLLAIFNMLPCILQFYIALYIEVVSMPVLIVLLDYKLRPPPRESSFIILFRSLNKT